ncbi:MAG: hypothetical protein QG567_2444, partial [Campylobacterota bacterium]|nr:hypothetical protein [Campylobacterota bacterium]
MQKIKKLEFLTYLLVLTVVIAIGVVSFILDNERLETNLDNSLKYKSDVVKNFFENSIKYNTDIYNYKLENILKEESVIEAFENKNREKLYDLLLPIYKSMIKDNASVNLLNFHTVDNHMFLRMSDPQRYGDDISSFRHAVVDTNKRKVKNIGFETGIFGIFQRVIHPVFNKKGEHIGSVEVGLFIDYLIQNIKYVIPDSQIIVLVNKENIVEEKRALYKIALQTNEYVVFDRYRNDFFDSSLINYFEINQSEVLERDGKFFTYIKNLELSDFEKKPISKVGIFIDVTSEVTDYKKSTKKLIFILSLLTIIIFILLFIIFYMFNKKIRGQYSQIIEKDLKLEEVNKNLNQLVSQQIEKIRNQEQILFHQSKMSLMGEMINAIAHQWRQPLSVIALNIQDIEDAFDANELDQNYLKESTASSMQKISFLSKTIDDFKNFFKQDDAKREFSTQEMLRAIEQILKEQFSKNNINIEIGGVDFTIDGYKNELSQIIL